VPTPFWRRNALIWAIVCINAYSFAVIGPVFVVVGLCSFFVRPPGTLQLLGAAVESVPQKILWTVLNSLISVLGVWFVAWHRRAIRPTASHSEMLAGKHRSPDNRSAPTGGEIG
jgi:hypothetical protein